jgi:hypothetical protein
VDRQLGEIGSVELKGRRCANTATAIRQANEEFGGTPIFFEEQTANHRCEAIFGA